MNETEIWLRIIITSELKAGHLMEGLLDECLQLKRILNASITTARKSQKN